jgi:Tfp pilus assembly protein PilN
MSKNDISLLPSDLRGKENEEKAKVKDAMGDPKFKMHVPGADAKKKVEEKVEVKKEDDISIGLDHAEQEKPQGVFKVVKKKPTPVAPPPKPKPQPLPPKPEPPKDDTFSMKFPKFIERLRGNGKKVIREATDKLEEVKSPPPISEVFHKDLDSLSRNDEQAEVNLISEDYQQVVRREFWIRFKNTLIVVLIFVIGFTGTYVYLKLNRIALGAEYSSLEQQISQTDAAINSYSLEKKQAELLKDRTQVLKILLDNHVYWTQFLDLLEHNTVNNVYYTNFVAEAGGSIILTARAATYSDLANQLAVFEEAPFVETVEINGATQVHFLEEAVMDGELPEEIDLNEVEGEEAVEVVEPEIDPDEVTPVQFNVVLKLKQDALYK